MPSASPDREGDTRRPWHSAGPCSTTSRSGVSARAEIDAFWSAGTEAGYRSDGEPGLRPQYREDYYGGFLLDPDGNSVEAVHYGATRGDGRIDHLWLRVSDVAASAAFYATVGRVAGHMLVEHSPAHVQIRGASGSFSLIAGEPTRSVHLAFPADDDATVDAFHAVATAAEHPSNGAPGERPEYHAGYYYGAFVLDPTATTSSSSTTTADHSSSSGAPGSL